MTYNWHVKGYLFYLAPVITEKPLTSVTYKLSLILTSDLVSRIGIEPGAYIFFEVEISSFL